MKGKNLLWGTALYLVMITALYNRRDATLTVGESEEHGKQRAALSGDKSGIRRRRGELLKTVDQPGPEFTKAYTEKDWLRR